MTRFPAIALALLLVAPAKAADCPIPHAYPQFDADLNCISLHCHGLRMLREAYRRGEIQSVHLARKSECMTLSGFDAATGEAVEVPCTYDYER